MAARMMSAAKISWTKWNHCSEIVDYPEIWVGKKRWFFPTHTKDIGHLTPTE